MSNVRRNPRRDANEAQIVAELRRLGFLVLRLNAEDVPDLLLVHPRDGVVLVEIKTAGGSVSPGQQAMIDNINAHGGVAFIARSTEEILHYLDIM
ncbi:MAG TPA: VRR-NUC domain-containing protein [Bellilinea sp.]|nr:VRR-NUC domain-containing protein [Bellilinea sp.]